MIDQLITALSKEVEMSAEEIADTIWLALQMQEFQSESVSSGLPLKQEDRRGINKQESQPDQGTLPKPEPKASDLQETATQPPEEQKAGIYPRNQQQSSKSLDLAFKAPDAPSLREPLTLARALKPLMRRVSSGRELVLDEAATIQRIADEGLWIPVLRPTVEPWLDLELVVDEAISMQIWRHTIRELERLLKNYGIFRDVRVWGLITDEKEQVQIRRGIGATAKNQSPRSPKELIDPTGRRLVLVVSDCVSSMWRNGGITPVLELWAKQGSMAIVQMLPKWLWKRTALGRASEVRLQGLTPGVSNHKLIAKEVSLWDELDEETGVKVPVFTLEQDKVATWAQMLSGKGSIWTSGYVFKLDASPVKKETELPNLAHSELSAEQRVQAFRVTASPMARKLAGLLASAPVISLPIVRLIRKKLLEDSEQVHVAEVFLGGLLKPLSEINADTNPDYVHYEFMDGVRELLVDSVPSNYVLNVVEKVSEYVAEKVGLSLETFPAVLRNPQQVRDSKIANEVAAFAMVRAQVLRRLGGEYAALAEQLERKSPEFPKPQVIDYQDSQITEAELLEVIEQAAKEGATELDLSGNELTALPPEIGKLTQLKKLILGKYQYDEQGYIVATIGNKLSALPAEIGLLNQLEELQIVANRLQSLPPEIVQLTNLQTLDLSNNQLSALPSEIVQLTNLQTLDLSSNQLSALPPEIVQLTNLQTLDLSNNQLSALPSEIVQLTNLQTLDLSSNQLSALPPEIVQLTNLQSLDLSSNQLSALPPEIVQLTNLKKLDLRRNPVPIPPDILGPKQLDEEPGDVNEILDFYFRVQDPTETEPLYEAKFLIVGERGVGKTSLAKKIEDENYKLQSDEKSTEGIDVLQWQFKLPNGKDFRVNIWDFGGQEIYHQTHQFFLTERSLYALVVDTRKENTDFYWWLKVIELLSDNSPVLIIKNEKQDRQCEVNERQLRGKFTNLEKVLATNLATNRGLTEVKNTIEQYITRLIHVDTPLPKLWVRVRSALENDSRNYISRAQYYQLCELNNLTDHEDMSRLSRYLHDLGVCLHFQDDSTLKHYVILKPEWGTTAVYKVLDNDTVKKNLGCFTQDELKDIWSDDEYADMRDELLQLMMRFKLCYPIPNRPNNYIAPQLLDINQPDYTWDETNNLILRYEYEFMPKVILTRFIVETHPWIEEQQLVWRNGVVLDKDQSRAEVIEHYNQREIKVRVAGNRKKELLALVTHELEKIHQSFERLQYQTLVPCNCRVCEGSQTPYTYPLDKLHEFLDAGVYQIQCRKSRQMVNVRRLIDDVDLQSSMPEPITRNLVFISYSHEDKKWFDDLKIHLQPLIREQNLQIWDDTKIKPGENWRDEIAAALASAKVALLLVSPNFLASDYISKNELPPLLEAAKAGGVRILWVPLRSSSYKETAIEKYQAAHSPEKPLNKMTEGEQDKAWIEICKTIMVDVRRLINDVNLQSSMPEPITKNLVFISYSHKDKKWFDDLKFHLEPSIREQNLQIWDDTKIKPGEIWRDEIAADLASAKVALLLVSPNFLASDYISKNKLPPLLEAAEAGGVTILWVPLRSSNYKETAIEKYQAAHSPEKPLNTIAAGRRDKAWVKICEIIKAAANL